jgi:ricin-type beta-trefoil lectin protein/putative Ig domain-containing protein
LRIRVYAAAGACLAAALYTLPGLTAAGSAAAAVSAAPPGGIGTAGQGAAPAAIAASSTAAATATPAVPPALPSGAKSACRRPADVLVMQCQSFVLPSSSFKSRSAAKSGTAPAVSASETLTTADLQAAYGIASASASKGTGETVAIVDAFYDANADSDLTQYRSENNLPACTQASGCLSVYNEGGTNLYGDPSADPPPSPSNDDWTFETSLDLDMVSAICPNCKIDLISANSDHNGDLYTAEDTAVTTLGAKFVSNSWTGINDLNGIGVGADNPGEAVDDAVFNHPGVATVFASGDYGFGASWPASSQFVTSVGGTSLSQNSAGAWTSSVWNDQYGATGAGCSAGEPVTAWGFNPGGVTTANNCGNRVQNDVSAVASSLDGIEVYDGNDPDAGCSGNCGAFGTSVATPIITAMYALAGTPKANTYPVSYLYQHKSDLTPVTSGADTYSGGPACESAREWLCAAYKHTSAGYDGPGGLGTVTNGNLGAFTTSLSGYVSVANPGTYDYQAGQSVNIPVKAISQSGATLTYAASGLPAGLSINTTTGVITGKLSTTPVSATVKLSVTGGTDTTSVSFRLISEKSLSASFHASPGAINLSFGGMCLDDSNDLATNGNKIDIAPCKTGDKAEQWTYAPSPVPGGAGLLEILGKCATITGSSTTAAGDKVVIGSCVNAGYQKWLMAGSDGELYNPASGMCLDEPSTVPASGTAVQIEPCDESLEQAWKLGPSPITSGVAGMCMTYGATSGGAPVYIAACNGSSTQKFALALDNLDGFNAIDGPGGKCVSVKNNGTIDGSGLVFETCTLNDPSQFWLVTADGTLENAFSEKCLADPSNSTTSGKQLVLEDCYGAAGELWATS